MIICKDPDNIGLLLRSSPLLPHKICPSAEYTCADASKNAEFKVSVRMLPDVSGQLLEFAYDLF